jgi:hypothetical protein
MFDDDSGGDILRAGCETPVWSALAGEAAYS